MNYPVSFRVAALAMFLGLTPLLGGCSQDDPEQANETPISEHLETPVVAPPESRPEPHSEPAREFPEVVEGITADHADMDSMLKGLLYRVDIVPAGLALGQAAYESGYGTSRFAIEGNSLFGQWTYKGDGLKPREQRTASKGDHRIKTFEWPFDSVRGYFINLFSHPAYEDFRRLRAEVREAGRPLSSMELADGLLRYSERGQEYVDSLKGIMRVNKLHLADDVVFRDEPLYFLISEESREGVEKTRKRIAEVIESGEAWEILERMRLE